jgi:hypothetical protein
LEFLGLDSVLVAFLVAFPSDELHTNFARAFLTKRFSVIDFISCENSILSNLRSLTMPSAETILLLRHAKTQLEE